MIIYMYFNLFFFGNHGQITDPAGLPRIHKDQTFYPVNINAFYIRHVKKISHGLDKKIPEIFFTKPWKDQKRTRVEFLGGKHRCHSIIICINMGCDYCKLFIFFHTIKPSIINHTWRAKIKIPIKKRSQFPVRKKLFKLRVRAQHVITIINIIGRNV